MTGEVVSRCAKKIPEAEASGTNRATEVKLVGFAIHTVGKILIVIACKTA